MIIGPVEKDDDLTKNILSTFNSINANIQFTMEVPQMEEPLTFLDISVRLNNRIEFDLYT